MKHSAEWLDSRTVSMRLTSGDQDLIASHYETISGTAEHVDFRKFFFKLLDMATQRRTTEVVKEIPVVLPANVVTVTLDPMDKHILEMMVEKETTRTEQNVDPGEILRQLFIHQVCDGPGDWLPKRFSTKELRKIQDELKAKGL